MKYCNRCLYPANHPYGLIFDSDGICSGCRVHEEKDSLNWTERFRVLEKIVEQNAVQHRTYGFDCIVPVSGGGDSYYIVHVVKNILGMNPLLVHYNPQYNTKIGIRNLGNLATVFDCDLVTSTVSPDVAKCVTRYTLRNFGSMYWHVLAGMLTFPVQAAVKFRVPLIIWGVHPWSDQTGMYSHLDEVEMTERCRKEHGLMGIGAEDLLQVSDGLSVENLRNYFYPPDNEIAGVGVRGIYLSNYVRWDSKAQHEKMIDMYGYETALQRRTFNSYEDVHCWHSASLHDYIKFLKLGYSKVTDHATREIRLRRMTREQGIALVGDYVDRRPEDTDAFLNWVGMTETEFWGCVWDRRDESIWRRGRDGWELRDSVANHSSGEAIENARLRLAEPDCVFRVTDPAEDDTQDHAYLLMGRGYINERNYGALENAPPGAGMSPRSRPSIIEF